jgi:hypothetical protein
MKVEEGNVNVNKTKDMWSYYFTPQSFFILWYLLEQKQKTIYCS